MKRVRKILLIGFIIFPAFFLSAGEINIGTGVTTYFTDNIFLNSTSIEDLVSKFSLDLNYEKKSVNIYANGGISLFLQNPDFDSFNFDAGIEFLKYLKGRSFVYLNFGYSYLEYKDYFTDFNYSGPHFQVGIKYYLSKSVLTRLGYNFEIRNYFNFSSFDFQNHTLFLEVNKFFQSQTTFRLQTGINFRYYPHISEPDVNNYYSGITNSMSVPNFYSLVRVSQGIGAKLGLIGEIEFRKNFRGIENSETLINNSYVIYPYNDNYLWDGLRVSLGLKYILPGEIGFSFSYSFSKKNYPGVYVMDEEGIVSEPLQQRKDDLHRIDMSVSKALKRLNIYLGFSSSDNSSLDAFYVYRMLTLSAGIKYYF